MGIIEAIIAMYDRLGLKVIAEGEETVALCFVQGYLYSKPVLLLKNLKIFCLQTSQLSSDSLQFN